MDSSSIDMLKQLYSSGLLDAREFARLATELSQQPAEAGTSSGAGPSQLQPAEPTEEDEMLVDEDGNPMQQSPAPMQQSSAPSSQHTPASPASPIVSSPLPSVLGSPDFVGSAAASPAKPADGPANWESGMLVYSTDLKINVTFIRLGGPDDFVNSSRAKISYERVKPRRQGSRQGDDFAVGPTGHAAINFHSAGAA